MKGKNFLPGAIFTSVLLAGTALLLLQLTGGVRLTAASFDEPGSEPDSVGKVIARYAPVELVERRDDHTRVYEIVREVETTHPDGSRTVDAVRSYIFEKGSGLCYRDERGNFVPAVPEWRQTPEGFVIDRCHYTLRVGNTLEGCMSYTVKGRRLLLRPSYLMVSDGTRDAVLGVPDPNAVGLLDFRTPSKLRFPAAFGPGLDVEIVAERSGFHQNLVIRDPLRLPRGFHPAETRLYLHTSVDASDYVSDPTSWCRLGAQPIDLRARGVLTRASDVAAIIFGGLREGADGILRDGPIVFFELSPVYDSLVPGIPRALAERQLLRDDASGELFLLESIPFSLLEDALLPVVWDYDTKSGSIEGEETWETGVTYLVTSNVYVWGTLTIEAGAFVKLNKYTSISIQAGGGKVEAVGTPTDYVRFTESGDDDLGWGEPDIPSPPAVPGRYNYAIQLGWTSSSNSKVQYCMFRKGGMAVWDLQELDEAISHNVISEMDEGIGIWFYGLSDGAACHNNLIRNDPEENPDQIGIALTYASVRSITNNTIDGWSRGINAWNSTCDYLTDNLFSNDDVGVNVQGTCELGLDYNGYWQCETEVSGASMGEHSVELDSDPYVGQGNFFLDQFCDLIDAGSRAASDAGLSGHTTSAGTNSSGGWTDAGQVDIGYHYPHLALKPYVQKLQVYDEGGETKARATIMWHTTTTGTGYVDYGDTPGYGSTVSGSYSHTLGGLYIYEKMLSGLVPDALYHYRVRHGSDYSHDNGFYTAKTTGDSFRFLAYGDNRGGSDTDFREEHFQVANSMLVHAWSDADPVPRFVLHVGDFVNSGGTVPQWEPHFFDPAAGFLGTTPLFPTIGNHEYYGDEDVSNYRDLFCVDTGTENYEERWYSFYYGDCLFICLNSNVSEDEMDPEGRTAQENWLQGQLQDASKTWRFVFLHHPAFSDGGASSGISHDGTAQGGHNFREAGGMEYAHDTLAPLFREYGVDAVFCGHNHFYERAGHDTEEEAGLGPTHIVTGGAGAPGSGGALHASPDFTDQNANGKRQYAEPVFHHVTVDVMSDKLLIRAWRKDGSVLDFDARDTSEHFLREDSASTMAGISTGATWRYCQDGYPGDGWTEYGFDDSGWHSGATRIGFGHPAKENTTIDENHRNKTTYYFRREFNAGVSLGTVDFAYVAVLHDDGCVVYLNEVEVFRSNLPAPLSPATPANDKVSQPYEDNFIRCLIDKSLLQAQNNVLAVEVHRFSSKVLTDPDMAFDLKLRYFAEEWW